MARPSRSAMYADDATFLWKAILRSLAILVALVGIAITAWTLISHVQGPSDDADSSSDSNDYDETYDFYPEYTYLSCQFVTLGLSIAWNLANIVTLLARNRFIHPGANVACDLLLWLGISVTCGIAATGATTLLFANAYDYDTSYQGLGYGGGTYSNGTQFEYTANGTAIPVTDQSSQCGGFTTCAAMDQYVSATHHKGVVVAVGAAIAFVVLLFHFALFISACRYTHARRQSDTSRQARAITAEATEIARKMIADMTGPNGGFIPINQAQQGGSYQPLQQSEAGEAMEMRQRQSRAQPGYDYQPVQQREMEEGEGQRLSREDVVQRQYDPPVSRAPMAESSLAAVRRGKQRAGDGPDGATHPALGDDPGVVSHAI